MILNFRILRLVVSLTEVNVSCAELSVWHRTALDKPLKAQAAVHFKTKLPKHRGVTQGGGRKEKRKGGRREKRRQEGKEGGRKEGRRSRRKETC